MNSSLRRLASFLFPALALLVVSSCTFLSSQSSGQSGSVGTAATAPPLVATAPQQSAAQPSAVVAAAKQAASQPAPPAQPAIGGMQEFSTAIRRVAEQVKPAIVQITSRQLALDIFNQPIPQTGVGSGVIYDRGGYILTNNHVVANADRLTVALPDGRSFDGKLVGADPDTDLAVLQIQGSNLPVAELGDSSQLAVGDWVVAIGNALALPGGPTVTVGVVSALGRTVQEPGDQSGTAGPFLYDLIQTDAAINPGNSGGALVNLMGQVVGINTLVAGMAEPGVQAQGIGFAIAINTAKPIAQQLVATGRVAHPFLGIEYTLLTPAIASRLGIQDGQGLVIVRVVAGSPADRAGLKRLDVIRGIDGQPITSESTLGRVLSTHKPGDVVTLSVRRGGQTMDVRVTLGERPS